VEFGQAYKLFFNSLDDELSYVWMAAGCLGHAETIASALANGHLLGVDVVGLLREGRLEDIPALCESTENFKSNAHSYLIIYCNEKNQWVGIGSGGQWGFEGTARCLRDAALMAEALDKEGNKSVFGVIERPGIEGKAVA